MATFVFKKDDEEIKLDSLTAGPMKQSFLYLSKTIADQLKSIRCDTHNLEPVITLKSHGESVDVAGFAACCEEFASKVRNRIDLPAGTVGSEVVIMKKVFKYTDKG
jgi:hypothetical protein